VGEQRATGGQSRLVQPMRHQLILSDAQNVVTHGEAPIRTGIT